MPLCVPPLRRAARAAPARRELLRRAGALLLGGGAGGLGACAHFAADAAAQPEAVADGVRAWIGRPGEIGPANRGRVGNGAVFHGPQGAVVVNAGVSAAEGRERLAALERLGIGPVRALVLTHAHQEYIFGAVAFRRAGVPIHMHRQAAQLMAARCDRCLQRLRETLGETEMAGTERIEPDQVFDGERRVLDLIGRPLELRTWGQSSGPGDTAVWDPQRRVLVTGGLVDSRTIPDLQDADSPAWTEALHALRTLAPARIIAAHGPVSDAGAIDATGQYLRALDQRVAGLLEAGRPLSEVADAATLDAYAGWDGYDTTHRRNASVVYLRQERALLSR